jgi:hypothetical protein
VGRVVAALVDRGDGDEKKPIVIGWVLLVLFVIATWGHITDWKFYGSGEVSAREMVMGMLSMRKYSEDEVSITECVWVERAPDGSPKQGTPAWIVRLDSTKSEGKSAGAFWLRGTARENTWEAVIEPNGSVGSGQLWVKDPVP